VCAGGREGCEAHLRSVENIFEDVLARGGGLPMHPGWIGACGVTLEKMSHGGGHFVGPQASRMCVSTGMGRKGETDTQWMEGESERVKETGMDTWDQMLREFEGGGRGLQGAVGGDTPEGESSIAGEQQMLYAGSKYTPGSAEKRGRGGGDHDTMSLSVPPPLLQVKEEAGGDEGVGGCDDLSWLVGPGNVWCILRFTDG